MQKEAAEERQRTALLQALLHALLHALLLLVIIFLSTSILLYFHRIEHDDQ